MCVHINVSVEGHLANDLIVVLLLGHLLGTEVGQVRYTYACYVNTLRHFVHALEIKARAVLVSFPWNFLHQDTIRFLAVLTSHVLAHLLHGLCVDAIHVCNVIVGLIVIDDHCEGVGSFFVDIVRINLVILL
jgi:hypothetical protein